MARRSPRTPFVVTVAAAAASVFSPGCGGETDSSDPTPTGGTGGTTATGGTGGSTGGSGGTGALGGAGGSAGAGAYGGTGGGGTGGTTGGAGGVGGVGGGPGCPPTLPAWYEQCASEGLACQYEIPCQSGNVSFSFSCSSTGYWTVQPGTCAQPYDSCPGTDLYCTPGYGWSMPQGTNPPSPCPPTQPALGEQCYSGGFGGVHEKCGYLCDPATGTGWTVMTCPMAAGTESKWESDGACGN